MRTKPSYFCLILFKDIVNLQRWKVHSKNLWSLNLKFQLIYNRTMHVYSVSPKPHGLNFEFLFVILFAKFQKYSVEWVQSYLKFSKIKSSSEPTPQNFWNFAKSIRNKCARSIAKQTWRRKVYLVKLCFRHI